MSIDPSSQSGLGPDSQPDIPVDPVTPTPLPPSSPETGVASSVSPTALQTSDLGLPPNVAAGLAVLFSLLGGIIFLVLEKRNRFVRFWAMQSIYFGAAWIVFSIGSGIIWTILAHILWLFAGLWHLFGWLIYLGFVVVWIIMLIQAFSGKEWEVPVLGSYARKQLDRPPQA